jgi:hypothetical protein
MRTLERALEEGWRPYSTLAASDRVYTEMACARMRSRFRGHSLDVVLDSETGHYRIVGRWNENR